jgi:hypothetical protein
LRIDEIEPLEEDAAPGSTSVASVGTMEYDANPGLVRLYKRNAVDQACCVARIERKKGQGWRFITTPNWGKFGLPHFGNLYDVESPVKGKKAHEREIAKVLTRWGINHDGLIPRRK